MKYSTLTIIALSAVLLSGCNEEHLASQTLVNDIGQSAAGNRFVLTRVGIVNDSQAYHGERGIYILKDTQTGREYVGVSGVGISELGSHQAGKNHRVEDER